MPGEHFGCGVGHRRQHRTSCRQPDVVEGTFETALKTLLNSAGIRQSDYPLEACIYANTPPLVRITRQGEQARECDAQ